MSYFVRKSDVLDLLYGIFDKYKMSTDKNTSIGKSFGTDVFEEIRNMPTAYSVDKIVEELEKIEQHCLDMSDWQGQSAICDAIEIVKQGGVSDDVCEWKQDDMCEKVYRVCGGCFTSTYQKDFKFCPYCGKKIKVGE